MMTVEPDLNVLRAALRDESERLAQAIHACARLDQRVPGLDWTSEQLVAHLTVVYRVFAATIRGERLPEGMELVTAGAASLPQSVAAANAASVAAVGFGSPTEAADELRSQAGELLAALAPDRQIDVAELRPTPWYGSGISLPLGTLAALAVSETLVHGLDLDRALGRRNARLARPAAAAVAPTVMSSMLPLLVDPRGVRGRDYGFELRVRGGRPFVLRIAEGRAWCENVGDDATNSTSGVDCVISLTGEAALLIGFARRPLWRATATGAALAYGRKPWLGLRFHTLFLTP
ncbi:uncharacterized protein (TIGR03083 family) [Streptacidiphilus sp. MAP12-20]|uniref:maleylpyruvate isomerase N-terminal domain-containing protein n=1 Tax=Streptacidiphilus sp. MAP12-20 TaxID=3156299 RepID=UPI0035164F63